MAEDNVNWRSFVLPIVILVVFIGAIIGIVNWQQSQNGDNSEPELSINLPNEEITTEEEEVVISGTTSGDNRAWINDQELNVEKEGDFAKTLPLDIGKNSFEIRVENEDGVTKTIGRTIYREEAAQIVEKTTTTTKAVVSQIGENQKLSQSGPADVLVGIFGFGVLGYMIYLWRKSKTQLNKSFMK